MAEPAHLFEIPDEPWTHKRCHGACVDHKEVHGVKIPISIVCNGCNVAIAMANHDAERLRQLADYCEEYRSDG